MTGKNHLSWAVLLLLFLGSASCSREPSLSGLVAVVNGREITKEEFRRFYDPQLDTWKTTEEGIRTVRSRLDQYIDYILMEQSARREGAQKTDRFKRRKKRYMTDILNRYVRQREIVGPLNLTPAEVDSFARRSRAIRHLLHIVTYGDRETEAVKRGLENGTPWSDLALKYSRDKQARVHKGDLGWLAWGEGPLSVNAALQDSAFAIPVGSWRGPIEAGGFQHFIKVQGAEDRPSLGDEQEKSRALSQLSQQRIRQQEQAMSDRMWVQGGYRINEDNFRWLVQEIQQSFATDPRQNPVPVLDREDRRRVVIDADDDPYTAQDLLDRIDLINPQGRNGFLVENDWRDQFIRWVISDAVADYARSKGYDEDPTVIASEQQYMDAQLYARGRDMVIQAVPAPPDTAVMAYARRTYGNSAPGGERPAFNPADPAQVERARQELLKERQDRAIEDFVKRARQRARVHVNEAYVEELARRYAGIERPARRPTAIDSLKKGLLPPG